jgi:23S rRNA (pseudouridine1915-N3)-methyltransferase
MRLQLLAIGRMKKGPETQLLDTYVDRLEKSGRALGITSVAVHAPPESRDAETARRKDEEAQKLLAFIGSDDLLIALDEHGSDATSRNFSQIMQTALDDSWSGIAVAIGGPDGHGDALLKRANHTIRFGKMTWPHQIVRILAAEQLYRATTILQGHPYHRD